MPSNKEETIYNLIPKPQINPPKVKMLVEFLLFWLKLD